MITTVRRAYGPTRGVVRYGPRHNSRKTTAAGPPSRWTRECWAEPPPSNPINIYDNPMRLIPMVPASGPNTSTLHRVSPAVIA